MTGITGEDHICEKVRWTVGELRSRERVERSDFGGTHKYLDYS